MRFVGGSVRDAIMDVKGFDLDLATDLSPHELVEACVEEGLKTVPIGITHGTVGVVIDDNVLEVTSLRKDIKTDGRHAEIVFTDNWEEDASRRDLTINAVYADEDGNVFDYYNGIDDLENGKVKFIGNANQRIKEDYLRILRFFRFYSIFGKGEIDKKALQACKDNSEGVQDLSKERIRDELQKLLLTKNAVSTLKIMTDNDILSYVLPNPKHLDKLEFLINIYDAKHIKNEVMRRLFIIYLPDEALAENLATRLRLTKAQKQDFVRWATNQVTLEEYTNHNLLLKLVYEHGKEFAVDKLLLLLATQKTDLPNLENILEEIQKIEELIFPLRGRDIIEQGIGDIKNVGKTLKSLEILWIDSNFSMSRDELLKARIEIEKAC